MNLIETLKTSTYNTRHTKNNTITLLFHKGLENCKKLVTLYLFYNTTNISYLLTIFIVWGSAA